MKELVAKQSHQLETIQNSVTIPTTTNHINSTTNNNHIHMYLNTHCKNAMNIDQFIDNMEIVPDDIRAFQKDVYCNGAFKLLKRCFEQLDVEERPMHCAKPVTNKPVSFFVRDEDEWKEESQSEFLYQTKCIEEFHTESEKLAITKFFDRFGMKLFLAYQDLCKRDPKLEQTRSNMASRTSNGDDKMSVLDDLVKVLECSIGGTNG